MISLGIPKLSETFIFFSIADVPNFKAALKQLSSLITSTAEIQQARNAIVQAKAAGDHSLKKVAGINIAFTSPGLKTVRFSSFCRDATDIRAYM